MEDERVWNLSVLLKKCLFSASLPIIEVPTPRFVTPCITYFQDIYISKHFEKSNWSLDNFLTPYINMYGWGIWGGLDEEYFPQFSVTHLTL